MITSSPHSRTRATRSSVPSEEYLNHGHGNSGSVTSQSSYLCSTTPCTPVTTMAPSSLNSPAFSPGSHPNIYSPTNSSVFSPASTSPGSYDPGQTPPPTPPVKGDKKFQTTPPAKKKQAVVPVTASGSLQPDGFPLTKSKSHESQLASRIDSSSESNLVRCVLHFIIIMQALLEQKTTYFERNPLAFIRLPTTDCLIWLPFVLQVYVLFETSSYIFLLFLFLFLHSGFHAAASIF